MDVEGPIRAIFGDRTLQEDARPKPGFDAVPTGTLTVFPGSAGLRIVVRQDAAR
jgi:hypothetical protein